MDGEWNEKKLLFSVLMAADVWLLLAEDWAERNRL